MSYKKINPLHQEIGKTIATEKFLNTMDGFWFALKPNVIINSFDFVTVNNLFDSKTIGIVKELQAVAEHDYYNYFSDNYTISRTQEQIKKEGEKEKEQLSKMQLNGVVLAKVAIMANTGVKVQGYKEDTSINFPVGVGKTVRYATAEEIMFAIGIPHMENHNPA